MADKNTMKEQIKDKTRVLANMCDVFDITDILLS